MENMQSMEGQLEEHGLCLASLLRCLAEEQETTGEECWVKSHMRAWLGLTSPLFLPPPSPPHGTSCLLLVPCQHWIRTSLAVEGWALINLVLLIQCSTLRTMSNEGITAIQELLCLQNPRRAPWACRRHLSSPRTLFPVMLSRLTPNYRGFEAGQRGQSDIFSLTENAGGLDIWVTANSPSNTFWSIRTKGERSPRHVCPWDGAKCSFQ